MSASALPSRTKADGATLSVVVPCFNEQEALPLFYKETCGVLERMKENGQINSWQFVFVDDGSRDGTLSILRQLAAQDESVHYVSFSRNFGKEAALYAGLAKASGDWCAVMDADLQDPPRLLEPMLKAVQTGEADCAATRRVSREGEPVLRSLFARSFYKIMRVLSDVEVVDGARDFRVMSLSYAKAVLSLDERNRFSKGIFPWVGFKVKWFEFENTKRAAGKSKWSFWKLFLYSIDGITGFSTKPLALASCLGVLSLAAALVLIIYVVARKLIFGDATQGWASLVCIILAVGGFELFTTGIVGQYIAKIYTEIKHRPLYIVSEEN